MTGPSAYTSILKTCKPDEATRRKPDSAAASFPAINLYKNLMALRSLIRKMPALGLRPPQIMGPVRALSPAAGSRFMSYYSTPEVKKIIQDEMAQARAEVDRTFGKEMRESRPDFCQAFRAQIQENRRARKALVEIMMASNAVIILSVPTILYLLSCFH